MSVDLSSPPTTRHRLSVPTLLFFLVLVVAGAAGGAYAGLRYLGTSVTAESRLVVGDQSVRAQSVPGYALATQQLANVSQLSKVRRDIARVRTLLREKAVQQ